VYLQSLAAVELESVLRLLDNNYVQAAQRGPHRRRAQEARQRV
jgi:hypothetical protein